MAPSSLCPGPGLSTPGTLCLYTGWSGNLSGPNDTVRTYSEAGVSTPNTADNNGFYLALSTAESGYTYWLGSYAYTAP
jgi:hypothetical protein